MSAHAEAGERRGLCGHLQDEPVAMTALEPVRVWFAKANFRLREQPVIGPDTSNTILMYGRCSSLPVATSNCCRRASGD